MSNIQVCKRKSMLINKNQKIDYTKIIDLYTLYISDNIEHISHHRIDLEIQIHQFQGRSSIINNLFDCLS